MRKLILMLFAIIFLFGCRTYVEVQKPEKYFFNQEYFAKDTVFFKVLYVSDTLWMLVNQYYYYEGDTLVSRVDYNEALTTMMYLKRFDNQIKLLSYFYVHGLNFVFYQIDRDEFFGWRGGKVGYINFKVKQKLPNYSLLKIKSIGSQLDTIDVFGQPVGVLRVDAKYKSIWKDSESKQKFKGIAKFYYYPNYGIIYAAYPNGDFEKNLTFQVNELNEQ